MTGYRPGPVAILAAILVAVFLLMPLLAVVPVSFKVAHEVKVPEIEPKLVDLVHRLSDNVQFPGRRVLYTWIGGTRRDWRV